MKVTIDKHGNASSTQSQDLIRPNSTFVGGLAQAIGNIGETIGHGVHDASHAVGLDNITEGIERGMEDASHAVHNAVDDAYEAVDEVGGFLQSKASRATISIEVGAHNAMAKGLNTLNETFQFGFNRIEEKVRLDKERRLERSDSKSIIPPPYITNNLPLVASLLTAAHSSPPLAPHRRSLLAPLAGAGNPKRS